MTSMNELNLLTIPLAGANLIEASAGTGKTYTITGLVLRLILEAKAALNEILVVTYTEAATSELRDRIRKRLREAAEAFAGANTQDKFLQEMVKTYRDHAASINLLDFALNDFDQASIFTIHGFCMRTLQDHAFASGILFDCELITNQENLLTEIVQDFWRSHFYEASPLFFDYARSVINQDGLRSLINTNTFNPHLKIVPSKTTPLDYSKLEQGFRRLFDKVRANWPKARDEVFNIIESSPALKRNIIKPASVPGWVQSMDAYLSGECQSCRTAAIADKFKATSLKAATKKACSTPSHSFFDLCDAFSVARDSLKAAYDENILSLRLEFLEYLRGEIEQRKLKKNILFFDDLLLKLESALAGPGGAHLADLIQRKYKAALIDEFQDTDSIQYSIFKKVFNHSGSTLFLIGDPKQAIYGFRGADIFAYMEASKHTSCSVTLSENWRSEPNLISAVNAVFSNPESRPFLYDAIGFQNTRAPAGKNHHLLTIEGKTEPPLNIWFLRSSELSEGGGPIAKIKARPLVAQAVAAEISRLITLGRTGQAQIGDKPIKEGDIAVLVRANFEANLVQEALSNLGIHSVLYNIGNIFATGEAMEVRRLLAAITNLGNEALLKAALVTDMIGVSGEELDRLMQDEIGWEEWLVKFSEYHEMWARYGFFRMFRRLLGREAVLPRLMTFSDGERRCTNILHLSEVLHQSAIENRLNMFELVKWLSAQRNGDTAESDEHQLRLESDENAVKLVTIHKSKGLEYPIVFCPFIWQGSELRKKEFVFHDEADGNRLTYDLGSPAKDANSELAAKEQLAENLRLFYVALTRAQNRCYLVWGRINEAGSSAPAYLLHPEVAKSWDGSLKSLSNKFYQLDDDAIWQDLDQLREKAGGAIALSQMKTGEGEPPPAVQRSDEVLCEREFKGEIDRVWKVSSFSSLVFAQQHRAELADRDESVLPSTVAETDLAESGSKQVEKTSDIFSLPKGAATGILLHEIFEHLDFADNNIPSINELVAVKLGEHGFDAIWQEPISAMVKSVLNIELDSAFGSFSLAELHGHARLNELEFYFPLKRLSKNTLSDLFTRHVGLANGHDHSSNMERLRFEPVDGYMKGFIDLVFRFNNRFYILDWKSNFLGSTTEEYNQVALRKAVKDSFYNLQYTLYIVALHQYLKSRIPDYSYEAHFGEVFYVFLRGVDDKAGPAYGIYRDRPPRTSIEALASNLIVDPNAGCQ